MAKATASSRDSARRTQRRGPPCRAASPAPTPRATACRVPWCEVWSAFPDRRSPCSRSVSSATDQQDAALATALPDELITELARLRWLFVTARGSSFRLRVP